MERTQVCAHCQESFTLAPTGRPPRFCTAKCRRKAWEKARLDEAVAAAMAKAVLTAERRRAEEAARRRAEFRPNETPSTGQFRPNETPPAGQRRAGMPPTPPRPQGRRLFPPPPGVVRKP